MKSLKIMDFFDGISRKISVVPNIHKVGKYKNYVVVEVNDIPHEKNERDIVHNYIFTNMATNRFIFSYKEIGNNRTIRS